MLAEEEKRLYNILEPLNIKYRRYEHEAIYTIRESYNLGIFIPGHHCKNLFLKNRKGDTHYLAIIDENKQADLKEIAHQIGSSSLSFASEERLYKYLKLSPGSVSPFGLINDDGGQVTVLIDKTLTEASIINFHPNVNTATVSISFKDFERFLKWCNNTVYYIEM